MYFYRGTQKHYDTVSFIGDNCWMCIFSCFMCFQAEINFSIFYGVHKFYREYLIGLQIMSSITQQFTTVTFVMTSITANDIVATY